MRIVVGVDGSSGAQAALRWAIDEARTHQAALLVVHVWQVPYLGSPYVPATPPDLGPLEEEARHRLDRILAEEDTSDIDVERRLVCGSTAQALVDLAKDADLMVVGARGHGGFVGLLLGSVSDQVARHARCPVVIVPTNRSAPTTAG
jgi:nucleotide-binding universal stress UspA family protein